MAVDAGDVEGGEGGGDVLSCEIYALIVFV